MKNKKFCWWPQAVHSSRYYRDGCVWFDYAYQGIDGKWFGKEQFKPRARFSSSGRLKCIFIHESLAADPMMNQRIECYKIKCNIKPLDQWLGNLYLGDTQARIDEARAVDQYQAMSGRKL